MAQHSARQNSDARKASAPIRVLFVAAPLQSSASQLLDKMIDAMGLERAEIAIEDCGPNLHEKIENLNPEIVIALGESASEMLKGFSETRSVPIITTFHPAYLLNHPESKRQAWTDLQQAMRLLSRPPGRKD